MQKIIARGAFGVVYKAEAKRKPGVRCCKNSALRQAVQEQRGVDTQRPPAPKHCEAASLILRLRRKCKGDENIFTVVHHQQIDYLV